MLSQMLFSCTYGEKCEKFSVFKRSGYLEHPRAMGKMSLTSCRALSGKFSNVDRYAYVSIKGRLGYLAQAP